jgi:hypothetical protein
MVVAVSEPFWWLWRRMPAGRPPGCTLVVRGAFMKSAALEDGAIQTHDELGFWGISVFAHPLANLDAICRRALERQDFRTKYVRTTTAGLIRAAGYDVRNWDDDWHADVVFGQQPVEEDWRALRKIFGPDQQNPEV